MDTSGTVAPYMPPTHASVLMAQILRYPEAPHADRTAATNPLAARLLTNWRTHMPTRAEDGTGDFEDFWEMAARLTAALDSGADEVWLYDHNPDGQARLVGSTTCTPVGTVRDYATLTAAFIADPTGPVLNYGPLTSVDPLTRHVDHRADGYHRTRTFADHAGRFTAMAGYALDDPTGPELADVLTQMAAAGHEEAIVKAVRAKHGLWRLPVSLDSDANTTAVREALGWSLVHFEGLPSAFCVQEVIEMTFEYRVFVVDGEPVTGAGCIEEHTPLDAVPGEPFSPLVRRRRPLIISTGHEFDELDEFDEGIAAISGGEADPAESRPDFAASYAAFARTVAQQALAEDAMPRSYVIDCALSDGQPVVIEMNAVENAGLYASQPWLVTQALVG